ncbi:MAG TPA: hypothetical protein VF783_03810 [Terriglobales bacterium]
MKTKLTVVVVTMLFGLAMVAQTATQSVPAAPATGYKASGCACRTVGKCPMGKDGKCDMAAHKDPAMAYGKSCCGEGCCKDGKCYMGITKLVRADAAATNAP